MSFLVYDLVFLGIFILLLGIFLYRKRKGVKRDGLLLLYRTKWGINLIHRIGKKYQKTLKVLSYISVTVGYALMVGVLYIVGRIVWIYVLNPGGIVQQIKIPPITPLIPYLPQIFKLNLPPFYFTYWIIIIAVIAIFHEFAHGIFAAKNKVKIKNTGFGFFPFFLPIFLAAFVELDEKAMAKKKNFDQLAVLSAGTFANVLTAILFFGVMILFFSLAFAPSGVVFNSYPYNFVNTASINMVNGVPINNATYNVVLDLMNNSGLNQIVANSINYTATKEEIAQQNITPTELVIYYDAPAIRANLESTILAINGEKMTSVAELATTLHSYAPGTNITLTVLGTNNGPHNRTITLGQDPTNSSSSWLGVAFAPTQNIGILNQLFTLSLNRDNVYYASQIGDFGIFVYDLFWWLIIMSISVAFINMLPMGIFDGGRFFYITVLAITKKEKVAKWAFKIATWLFLFLLFVVMFFWVFYIR
jgi:membrane-associated protease RseP (regulator of RpoE activity)